MRTLAVTNSEQTRKKINLFTGDVFLFGRGFYIIAERNGSIFGVCLNQTSSTLEYEEIPEVVDLYQVTAVERL